jgi:hypothetical protein
MKVKTVRDGESEQHSKVSQPSTLVTILVFGLTTVKNLYVLSEIAQEMIKSRSKQHSWPLPSYPGKLKLPTDIFKPLPNPEMANKVRFILDPFSH